MGRGIRVGLGRCNVCGSAHSEGGELCEGCKAAVDRGDRSALVARSTETLSRRFGPHFNKDSAAFEMAIGVAVDRRLAGRAAA